MGPVFDICCTVYKSILECTMVWLSLFWLFMNLWRQGAHEAGGEQTALSFKVQEWWNIKEVFCFSRRARQCALILKDCQHTVLIPPHTLKSYFDWRLKGFLTFLDKLWERAQSKFNILHIKDPPESEKQEHKWVATL